MSPRPNPSAPRALLLVCVSAFAISTNYTNHGPLLGLMGGEFGLSAAEAGMTATAVFVGTAVLLLAGGVLSDRFGTRLVVGLGIGVVAAANLAGGLLVPSFPAVLAWRVVAGFGCGLAFGAGAAYVVESFPGGGAHFAQGLYGASFLLGSGSALLFMPLLVGGGGDWRQAFTLSGLGVAACWLAWVWLAPRSPRRAGAPLSGLRLALRSRNAWLFALCHTCGFGLAMVVSTWLTLYLVRQFGLPLAGAGALGAILPLTGILARSTGGAILERGVPPLCLIRASLVTAALGLTVMAFPMGSLALAMGGLVVAGIGIGLPYAAIFNGAAASVPRSPASAQALVGWGGTVFALVVPPIVGGLVDLTGSFAAGFASLSGFMGLVLLGTAWLRPFTLHGD